MRLASPTASMRRRLWVGPLLQAGELEQERIVVEESIVDKTMGKWRQAFESSKRS